MSESIRTYQTRPELTKDQAGFLDGYACLFGKAERTLFAGIQANDNLNRLKVEFQKRFGITARQCGLRI